MGSKSLRAALLWMAALSSACAVAPATTDDLPRGPDAAADDEEESDAGSFHRLGEGDAGSEPPKGDAQLAAPGSNQPPHDAGPTEPGPGPGPRPSDEEEGAATPATDAGRSAPQRDAATRDASSRDAASEPKDAGVRDATTQAVVDAGPIEPQPTRGRSSGCGKSAAGNDNFDNRSKRVGTRDRSYHVRVPKSYDSARAYPLVFRWHGSGGDGLSGGLGIEFAAGQDAIIVGADGISAGWTSSTQENDLLLFDAMYDELAQQYCIDLDQVFAYGFSAGGGFTNALGCKRASKVRATAAIAGFNRGDDSCAGAPVAAWFRHDQNDPSVNISEGRGARDRMLARNGCSTQSTTRDGCAIYSGCKSGYPVVFCETSNLGHDIAGDSAPGKVWQFFSTLP